jgi:hypothetical protein
LQRHRSRHRISEDHGICLSGCPTFSDGGTAGMEAHADLKRGVAAGPGLLLSRQWPLHAQSRQHGALRMILLRHGSAKDDQDLMPSYGPHHAPIPLGFMACQLLQRLQPALPGLQAPLFSLYSGGHQGATQDGDHFPLANRERVIRQ